MAAAGAASPEAWVESGTELEEEEMAEDCEWEEEEDTGQVVDLGLVQACPAWKLRSCFFPSKVGGSVAWLNLRELPAPDELRCGACGGPLLLLAQVYAPFEELEAAFHRMIYVWMCLRASCWVSCPAASPPPLLLLRCQLPRYNEFYPSHPPVMQENWGLEFVPKSYDVATCFVCGGRGPKRCGACRQASYCSREHQLAHWKAGHRSVCGAEDTPPENASLALPQWELVMEREVLQPKEDKSEEVRMSEFRELQQQLETQRQGRVEEAAEEELEAMATSEEKADQVFLRFREMVLAQPNQVLRYHRGGSPLWVSAQTIPQEQDIAPCQACEGPRQFEFQLMPQLLNHLNLDSLEQSIDWGTLAVFTCAQSCDSGAAYKQEFVWKQDFDPSTNATNLLQPVIS